MPKPWWDYALYRRGEIKCLCCGWRTLVQTEAEDHINNHLQQGHRIRRDFDDVIPDETIGWRITKVIERERQAGVTDAEIKMALQHIQKELASVRGKWKRADDAYFDLRVKMRFLSAREQELLQQRKALKEFRKLM